MEFISVIIPTYNRHQSLRRCLDSLTQQTYPKDAFEVIVVDDGSRDATKNAALSFTQELSLHYIYKNNGGPGSARNLGIHHAQGAIIAFIDDDCIAEKKWLENINMFFLNAPKALIVQGNTEVLEKNNLFHKMHEVLSKAANEKRIVAPEINISRKIALFFGPLNAAVKKSALFEHDLLFDTTFYCGEDIDLYRRIKKAGVDIHFDDKIAVEHLCHYDIVSFIKRFFGYGRGSYHLWAKWQGKTFAPWVTGTFTFRSLLRKHGFFSAVAVYFTAPLRIIITRAGFKYERLKTKKHARILKL